MSDASSEKEAQGSVNIALTGVSGSGVTYRLRTGDFAITGPKNVNFSTEANPDATSQSFELPAGNYLIRLKTGWSMERFNGMGWETVEAILLSANPAGFAIADQQHTGVVFLFRAGDDVIQLGNGVLDVSIAVDDSTTTCEMGQVLCAGACVNPTSDPSNCGACGVSCAAGEACQNGVCAGIGCPAGFSMCDGVCVNTVEDELHCGGCGALCGSLLALGYCDHGTCLSQIGTCGGAPEQINFASHNFNCGGCFMTCLPGMSCVGFGCG